MAQAEKQGDAHERGDMSEWQKGSQKKKSLQERLRQAG